MASEVTSGKVRFVRGFSVMLLLGGGGALTVAAPWLRRVAFRRPRDGTSWAGWLAIVGEPSGVATCIIMVIVNATPEESAAAQGTPEDSWC